MHGDPDPAYPFGRAAISPHRENAPRTQCGSCMGGGEVNGLPCPGSCGGRGWFDAGNPPPKEQ